VDAAKAESTNSESKNSEFSLYELSPPPQKTM